MGGRRFKGVAPARLASVAMATTLASAAQIFFASRSFAAEVLGKPTDGAVTMQASATALRTQAMVFNDILFWVLGAVCVFVLALLIWVVVRFNAKANPTPARFTHNTVIEIVWTAAPVLILMFFAIFSFRLLYDYHNIPKADVTVKVTGNQWYWNYEYPTAVSGGFAFDSNPLQKAAAEAKGRDLYRLAVDNPMVVPVNKNVQVLLTGADVLHSFFIPAFGVQNTTVPGRVTTNWFRATKTGHFYGQCNELCGVNHSFMPIEVDVVDQAAYDAWVAAHAPKSAAPTPSAPAPAPAPNLAPVVPGTKVAAIAGGDGLQTR